MRKPVTAALLSLLLTALFLAGPALAAGGGGLNAFLDRVNAQARTDPNQFTAQVSAQFGVPEAQVRVVMGQVGSAADAFMVFQLGQMANRPPSEVMQVYQDNRGRGWGVIARRLGIRPGSPEFHALKRGDLRLGPGPGGYGAPGGYGGPGGGGPGGGGPGTGGPPYRDAGPGHRPF